MDFLKFYHIPPLSKMHMQSYRNLCSLDKTYEDLSYEDAVEVNIDGSHDLTENHLCDLQEIAVQMMMIFRLEALMG